MPPIRFSDRNLLSLASDASPKISILIPTYNYAAYIGQALDSIISQDFEDYEVIISDDASSDNTIDVVKPYLENDARFRFFQHEKNLGMVANWNWCLEKARGIYIKFLFADDELTTPDSLACYAKMLDDHPEASLASSARRLIDGESKEIGIWNKIAQDGVHSGKKIIRECLLTSTNVIGEPSAVIFRKSSLPRNFDSGFHQAVDLEMWILLCTLGSFVYTSRALCSFRIHSAQQSAVNQGKGIARSEEARLFKQYFNEILMESHTLKEKKECWSILYYHCHRLGKMRNRTPDEEKLYFEIKAYPRALPSILLWLNYRILRLLKDLTRAFRL